MKPRLQDNDIEMYSRHNERRSVVAEGFTATLKDNICKYLNSISKNI